ncbi:MAG: glycosyltransferase [bacterium]
MSKPLILHCVDGLGIGGAEKELLLLLRHSPPQMFDHVVCHVGPQDILASEVRALGIPVYDLSGGRRHSLRALLRLLRLTRRLRPALIHADHRYGKLYARMVSRGLGIPLLATMGLTRPDAVQARLVPRTRAWRILFFAERIGARFGTDHTMAISQVIKDELVRAGIPPGRISVVYRGLNLDEFPLQPVQALAALRGTLLAPQDGPILLNVARLIPRKGQETIIRAMPLIRRRHPRATLLLVGDGPSRVHYEALAAAEGVSDAVRFLGTRRDVPQLLRLADVFVFPSLQEGTGVALLEAMAAARPCVVSDLPIFREVLAADGAGRFVPTERPDLFAEALLAVLEDPAGAALMGRRAREVMEARFDIRRNATDFARLCHRVIAASHPRRSMEAGPPAEGGGGASQTMRV